MVVLRRNQVRPYPLMRRPFILFMTINRNVRVVIRPHPDQVCLSVTIVSPGLMKMLRTELFEGDDAYAKAQKETRSMLIKASEIEGGKKLTSAVAERIIAGAASKSDDLLADPLKLRQPLLGAPKAKNPPAKNPPANKQKPSTELPNPKKKE